MNKLTDALTTIVEALTPLKSAERHRAVNAAMTLLGEVAKATPAGSRGATPDTADGGDSGDYSPAVAAWMKKHGISAEELDQVYHFGDDSTFVVQDAPGDSKKVQTLNTYTLTGLGRFLVANERTFDDDMARGFCATIGCLDVGNHATILKGKHPEFTGEKSKGYSLTNIGLTNGATLVKKKGGQRQMIDPARVLAALPSGLRDELLESYQEIMSNYLERRWEPAELNGGKFCEIVYSIVNGAITGIFPVKASKPARMVDSCRALEKAPAVTTRVGDRSLRVLIARMLPVLYEIRNNRGVGHVGGDVDANHMDAEAVQAMASWVMAELVRVFHGVAIAEARDTVDALVERKTPAIWDVEGVKRVLDPGMQAKNQVLMLLHHSTGWVSTDDLFKWVEYSNPSVFRSAVMTPLHKGRLIEYDVEQKRARISPRGSKEVEENLF